MKTTVRITRSECRRRWAEWRNDARHYMEQHKLARKYKMHETASAHWDAVRYFRDRMREVAAARMQGAAHE